MNKFTTDTLIFHSVKSILVQKTKTSLCQRLLLYIIIHKLSSKVKNKQKYPLRTAEPFLGEGSESYARGRPRFNGVF